MTFRNTYVLLLLTDYFPPFRRQQPPFQSFCSFKHASFADFFAAVLSFLGEGSGGGGGGRVTLAPAVLSGTGSQPLPGTTKKNHTTQSKLYQLVEDGVSRSRCQCTLEKNRRLLEFRGQKAGEK